jgi:diguanylate cyclase (GGDEF)-like protein
LLYALYAFNPDLNKDVSYVGLTAITIILTIYSGIAFGVLARGKEILQHLRTTFESNQELLVRTIMMDKLSKTDALTDSYNHMAYHEFMDKMVEQADSGKLALFLAVMDNFKYINDTYGHRAGDIVLREVAAIANSKVGVGDVVARYGGEEFTLIFTERSTQEVYDTVEEIRTAIATARHVILGSMAVTVSIGLNHYSVGMGKERFFQGADSALYVAKHSGKNRTAPSETLQWKQSSPA